MLLKRGLISGPGEEYRELVLETRQRELLIMEEVSQKVY